MPVTLGAAGFGVAWVERLLRSRVLWLAPLRNRSPCGGFRNSACGLRHAETDSCAVTLAGLIRTAPSPAEATPRVAGNG